MEKYITVKSPFHTEFTERHSEFISDIAPAETPEAAARFIESIRLSHRKATHVVYAYNVRGGFAKFSDDGEPSGTAGKPVFDVLKAHSLTDTVLTVTRYFGGILLGGGGLVRAYSRAAADAVNGAAVQILIPSAVLRVTLPYTLFGRVSALIAANPDIRAKEPVFSENVAIEVAVKTTAKGEFIKALTEATNAQAAFVESDEIYADFA